MLNVKEAISGGEQYLANNDLDGFYNYLSTSVADGELAHYHVGGITTFLEECGIDTPSAFKEMIPDYYCAYNDTIPASLMDGDMIVFPSNIQVIGISAFGGTEGAFESADLRGIKYVSKYAFAYSSLSSIYLPDPNDIEIGKDVFYNSYLKTVYVPQGTYYEGVIDWFSQQYENRIEVLTY